MIELVVVIIIVRWSDLLARERIPLTSHNILGYWEQSDHT